MEYITHLNKAPHVLAKKAYDDGYYIEAIQILHAWLENQAQQYLLLIGFIHFKSKQSEIWDTTYSINLNTVLKLLFILNHISKEEFDTFNKFNSIRNKIIHKIYKESYTSLYPGLPKQEYDQVFNQTLEEIYFFTAKCDEIIN